VIALRSCPAPLLPGDVVGLLLWIEHRTSHWRAPALKFPAKVGPAAVSRMLVADPDVFARAGWPTGTDAAAVLREYARWVRRVVWPGERALQSAKRLTTPKASRDHRDAWTALAATRLGAAAMWRDEIDFALRTTEAMERAMSVSRAADAKRVGPAAALTLAKTALVWAEAAVAHRYPHPRLALSKGRLRPQFE